MQEITIQAIQPGESSLVRRLIIENWGSERVIIHDAEYFPHELPGLIARRGGTIVGLLTYRLEYHACEIVTLNSFLPHIGVGRSLLDAVRELARQAGCVRIWLVTTNDNLSALGFYQHYGFSLYALHCGAVSRSRQIKPEIPLVGENGIPIRDELELEIWI